MASKKGKKPPSVFQEWVTDLPLKMQSVLAQNLRGVDDRWSPGLKKIGRWYRATFTINADPEHNDYMTVTNLPLVGDAIAREVEYLPVHYYHHLINALEIVAYRCPDENNMAIAMYYYTCFVHMLHLNVEDPDRLNWRLEDHPDGPRDLLPDPPLVEPDPFDSDDDEPDATARPIVPPPPPSGGGTTVTIGSTSSTSPNTIPPYNVGGASSAPISPDSY